jgi:hypothetical protein
MTDEQQFKMFALSRSVVLSTNGLKLPVNPFRSRRVLPIMSISGIGLVSMGKLTFTVWTIEGDVVSSAAISDLAGAGGRRSGRRIRTITSEIWSIVITMQGSGGPLATLAARRAARLPVLKQRHPGAFKNVWDPETGTVADWGARRPGHTQGWWPQPPAL